MEELKNTADELSRLNDIDMQVLKAYMSGLEDGRSIQRMVDERRANEQN